MRVQVGVSLAAVVIASVFLAGCASEAEAAEDKPVEPCGFMLNGYVLHSPGGGEPDVEAAVQQWRDWVAEGVEKGALDGSELVSPEDQLIVADLIVATLDNAQEERTDSGYQMTTVEAVDDAGQLLGRVAVEGNAEMGYVVKDVLMNYSNGEVCPTPVN